MEPKFTIGTKPSNAGWRARLDASPDGTGQVVPDPDYDNFPHALDQVQIAWYDDAVKITFKDGGPAHISQAYLPGEGRSVIIELKPA